MARLHDSEGELLGGVSRHTTSSPFSLGSSVEASVEASSEFIPPPDTGRNPEFDPNEFVPGLDCSYGSFAYSYVDLPSDFQVPQRSRDVACHNPIEAPEERHYCIACGGAYCSLHAEPAAHDCQFIIKDAPQPGRLAQPSAMPGTFGSTQDRLG